jgi:hypothetical protein
MVDELGVYCCLWCPAAAGLLLLLYSWAALLWLPADDAMC